MAYMSTAKAAEIRKKLKEEFPEIKFSVKKSSGSYGINVSIMRAPYEFRPAGKENEGSMTINHYWLEHHGWNHLPILSRIIEICNEGNHNNSNAMIDYFDVGWYCSFEIGNWNKDFEFVPPPPQDRYFEKLGKGLMGIPC